MTERRFTDRQVAEILKRATEVQSTGIQPASHAEGMTLVELQEIGREVGIAPEAIAQAARSVQLGDRQTIRRVLGLPVGVGLTANLGRQLSDEEWQRLVLDLRATFDARGRVREEGAFRQWTNGNLQVLVEPTPDGNQVSMRTYKQDTQMLILLGMGLVTLAIIGFSVKYILVGSATGLVSRFLPMSVLGAGLATFGAVRMSQWARERRAQMESVVARLRALTS